MNTYYPPNPPGYPQPPYQPPYGYQAPIPADLVYHPKYGYISRKKLGRKQVRADLNGLSGATLGMFLISLVIGMFLGVFFVNFGVYMDFAAYPDSSGMPPYLFHALNCAVSAVGTALPFTLFLVIRRPRLTEYLRTERNGFLDSLLFAVGGAGLCLAANYPAMWIGNLVEGAGMSSGSNTPAAVPDPLSAVLYVVSVAVLPPLFEEFAFRGVMLSALRRHGDAFALIVSSVLFGMMHMNVGGIPFAILCGFVMGYVYLRTGNIWINVAIHFLNNAQAVAGELLYQYAPEATAGLVTDLMFYGVMALGLIAIVLLLVRRKVTFRFSGGPKKGIGAAIPASSKLAAFATSPLTLLILAVCLYFTVSSMLGGY